MSVDVYVFLVRTDGGYILVDCGGPTDEAAELLLKNLDKVMGDGKLNLIILTHGHPDHAGMLTSVAHAHPGAQIVFHENEAPFILGAWPRLTHPWVFCLLLEQQGALKRVHGSGISEIPYELTLHVSNSTFPIPLGKHHLILPSRSSAG